MQGNHVLILVHGSNRLRRRSPPAAAGGLIATGLMGTGWLADSGLASEIGVLPQAVRQSIGGPKLRLASRTPAPWMSDTLRLIFAAAIRRCVRHLRQPPPKSAPLAANA